MKVVATAALAAVLVGSAAGAIADRRLTAALVGRPPVLESGASWQVQFTLRTGGRPLTNASPVFWIRGGQARSARAADRGGGRYRARVALPTPGLYRYGVSVRGQSIQLGTARVQARLRSALGLALGPDGALYAADREGTTVVRIDLRTRARTVAAGSLNNPLYIAFDRENRLAVADSSNRIYRFEPDGSRKLLAGTGTRAHTGDGGPATAAALGGSGGMDFDAADNLVLAEYDGWIRIVRRDGTIGTLAGTGAEGYTGDGGPAARAVLRHPHDVAVVPNGILVADSHNGAIRRIGEDGVIRTLAAGIDAPIAIAPAPGNGAFVADGQTGRIYRLSASGEKTVAATMSSPFGIAADEAGNVYVSELGSRRVKRVDAGTGKVTTLVP